MTKLLALACLAFVSLPAHADKIQGPFRIEVIRESDTSIVIKVASNQSSTREATVTLRVVDGDFTLKSPKNRVTLRNLKRGAVRHFKASVELPEDFEGGTLAIDVQRKAPLPRSSQTTAVRVPFE